LLACPLFLLDLRPKKLPRCRLELLAIIADTRDELLNLIRRQPVPVGQMLNLVILPTGDEASVGLTYLGLIV
jgi:hypothetical protein